MVNIQLIETCVINQVFVCPIEYGDMSGLDDKEEGQLNDWLENYPYCMFEYGESVEFARCEITGSIGNCVNVKIYKDQS